MSKLLFHVFLAFLLFSSLQCQIRRNIAYTFLGLDKNGDFILTGKQLELKDKDLNEQQMQEIKFTWDKFETMFPIMKYLQWDRNEDNQISQEEFNRMIKQDFLDKQTPIEGFRSFSTLFPEKELYEMCSENGVTMTPQSFSTCVGVWAGFQKDLFLHRVPSIYKQDRSSEKSLSYQEFKKILLKRDIQLPEQEENKVKKVFEKFELVKDEALDNNEIKIMEPLLLISTLDKDGDGHLSKEQSKLIFSEDYGGHKVFKFADLNDDGKLTKNEFIAHMIFALDLDDLKSKESVSRQADIDVENVQSEEL